MDNEKRQLLRRAMEIVIKSEPESASAAIGLIKKELGPEKAQSLVDMTFLDVLGSVTIADVIAAIEIEANK